MNSSLTNNHCWAHFILVLILYFGIQCSSFNKRIENPTFAVCTKLRTTVMRFLCTNETLIETNCWEGFGFSCTPSPPYMPWQVEHFWLLNHPVITFSTLLSHTSERFKVLVSSCGILWTEENILVVGLYMNWPVFF